MRVRRLDGSMGYERWAYEGPNYTGVPYPIPPTYGAAFRDCLGQDVYVHFDTATNIMTFNHIP